MPLQIPDPSSTDDAQDTDQHQIPLQLPRKVREFGYIPDCSNWRAGDLLLVSAVKKSFWQRSIVRVQESLGFDESHAEWHHAAVYIGKRRLLEARATGIRNGLVDEIASEYRIVVRRAPEISPRSRLRACNPSLAPTAQKLQFLTAVKSLWQSIRGAAQASMGTGTCRQLVRSPALNCFMMPTWRRQAECWLTELTHRSFRRN